MKEYIKMLAIFANNNLIMFNLGTWSGPIHEGRASGDCVVSAPQRCEISQGDPVLTHGFHRKVGVATCAVPILGRKNWLDPRSSPGNASLHIFPSFFRIPIAGGNSSEPQFQKKTSVIHSISSILLPSDATEWSIYEDERREPVNHQGHRGIIFSDVLLCITGKIESLETCAVENLGSVTIPDLIVVWFFNKKSDLCRSLCRSLCTSPWPFWASNLRSPPSISLHGLGRKGTNAVVLLGDTQHDVTWPWEVTGTNLSFPTHCTRDMAGYGYGPNFMEFFCSHQNCSNLWLFVFPNAAFHGCSWTFHTYFLGISQVFHGFSSALMYLYLDHLGHLEPRNMPGISVIQGFTYLHMHTRADISCNNISYNNISIYTNMYTYVYISLTFFNCRYI